MSNTTWQECRQKAEKLARDSFYCPGVFNEDRYAKDFALFLILRKQCIRFHKKGAINIPLAMNNLIIAINSFGQGTVNEIVRILFEPHLAKTALTLLAELEADSPRVKDDEIDQVLAGIIEYGGYNRPPLHLYQ